MTFLFSLFTWLFLGKMSGANAVASRFAPDVSRESDSKMVRGCSITSFENDVIGRSGEGG